VLEIGIGSGLNLPFYSAQVRRLYGVDPSLELQHMTRKERLHLDVEFLPQSAEEQLPLAPASIDTIVMTFRTAGNHTRRLALRPKPVRQDGVTAVVITLSQFVQ